MALRIKDEPAAGIIKMCELKGGELAVIMEGADKGRIVTRESEHSEGSMPDFAVLGCKNKNRFNASNGYNNDCSLEVRILPKGTVFILEQDEE